LPVSQAPSASDYEAADEGLRAAKAAYNQASDSVDALKSGGSKVPAAQIKAAETQRDSAHAGYLQARSAKRKLDAADSGSQRSAAIAQRAQAKAALDRAEADRDKATLKAPIAGIVVFNALAPAAPGADAQKATDGCAVSPAAAPFTIAPIDSARFSGNADEVDVARIKAGDTAVVKLDAFPGEEFKTTVGSIEPQAVQTKTGGTAFPVLLPLLKTGKTLRIGMSGTAEVAVDAVENALSIPAEALVDEKDGSFVFVLRDGHLRKTAVETGAMTDTRIQVVKGLAEGDAVALPPAGVTLTDGMSVKAGR
jgi:RND family efflux transporter MFP subunit